jgi:hypothetical protein
MHSETDHLKNPRIAGGMAQVVEHLLLNCVTLNSNPSTAKKKRQTGKPNRDLVAHLCNPSHSEGRRQRAGGSPLEASPEQTVLKTLLKKKITKRKVWGSVSSGKSTCLASVQS